MRKKHFIKKLIAGCLCGTLIIQGVPIISYGPIITYGKEIQESNQEFEYTLGANYAIIDKYIGDNTATEVVIPDTIEGRKVVEIGYEAFKDMANIEHVSLPNTLDTIDEWAFYNCTNLKEINLPNSLKCIKQAAFQGCTNISSVELPKGLEVLEDCFEGTTIKELTIPGSVERVKGVPYTLEYLTIEEGVKYIDDGHSAALKKVNFPDSVEVIANRAFTGCSEMEINKLPEKLKIIGDLAFDGCNKVYFDKLPVGLEELGGFSLPDNENIKHVQIPESVISINVNSFLTPTGLYNSMFDYEQIATEAGTCTVVSGVYVGCSGDNVECHELKIPEGVRIIPTYSTFYNYETVEMSDTVEILGSNIFWDTNLKNIVLSKNLKTIGYQAFRECTNLTNIELPESLVTIDSSAFYNCSNLEQISFPKNITTIAGDAFENTKWMENQDDFVMVNNILLKYKGSEDTIILPSNVEVIASSAIQNNDFTETKNIILPEGLKTISNGAFSGIKFGDLILPKSLKTIGSYAFAWCTFDSVTFSDGIEEIGENAFYVSDSELIFSDGIESLDKACDANAVLYIPNSVNNIGYGVINRDALIFCEKGSYAEEYAKTYGIRYSYNYSNGKYKDFTYTVNEKNDGVYIKYVGNDSIVNVPEEVCGYPVIGLDMYAFSNKSEVKEIYIPDSVTSIDSNAFDGCTSLTKISLPENLTTIPYGAFRNCISLKSLDIPEKVTQIAAWVFEDCTSLETINLPETLTLISNGAFSGCNSMKTINIPNNVTEIRANAFENCTSLESIIIPDSITKIERYVFVDCTALTNISFSSHIETIGYAAFSGCTGLKTINIPNSVKNIDEYAFQLCSNLKTVQLSNSMTALKKGTFHSCTSLAAITIPSKINTIESYAFQNCSSLKSITIPRTVKTMNEYAYGYWYDEANDTSVKYTDVSINGYANSAAEEYAKNSSIPFVILQGDSDEIYTDSESGYEIVSDETYGEILNGVSEKSTVETLIGNIIADGKTVQMVSADGNLLDASSIAGTGSIVQILKDGAVVEEITVVIKGDVDGNGLINVVDMEGIQKDILAIGKLQDVYLMAGHVASTDTISVYDMEAIQKRILNIA